VEKKVLCCSEFQPCSSIATGLKVSGEGSSLKLEEDIEEEEDEVEVEEEEEEEERDSDDEDVDLPNIRRQCGLYVACDLD